MAVWGDSKKFAKPWRIHTKRVLQVRQAYYQTLLTSALVLRRNYRNCLIMTWDYSHLARTSRKTPNPKPQDQNSQPETPFALPPLHVSCSFTFHSLLSLDPKTSIDVYVCIHAYIHISHSPMVTIFRPRKIPITPWSLHRKPFDPEALNPTP